jgi:hypothetical protein
VPKLIVSLTVQREDWEGSAPPITTLVADRHTFADDAEAAAFAERSRAWIATRPHPDDDHANGHELLTYYRAQSGRRTRRIGPDDAYPELDRVLGLED